MKKNDFDKKPEDKLTKQRIHEHLSNKNDVITEQDIKNVSTNALVPQETTEENKEEEKTTNQSSSPSIETTWNILEP